MNKRTLEVSILIPVYNEEKILEKNIKRVEEAIKKITKRYEIIIVDDGSKDNTPKVCKSLASKKVIIKRYENGPSRRENLAEAMKSSKNEIIVFIDLDLATDLKHLEELLESIGDYDICTGSRYMNYRAKRDPYRRILSICYNNFLKILFNTKVKDHQCGFKSFRREIILELIEEAGYDKSFRRGWFWDAEILLRAQKKKYRIKEFSVRWASGEDSSFRFRREIKLLGYIAKLRGRIGGVN